MSATTTRNQIATSRKVITDMRDLGYAIGNAERMTLESTVNAHKAYSKAAPEVQKVERVRFLTGFVAGALHASYDVAETIIEKSRTERTQAQVRAVQAAMQKFKYHIARDGAKAKTEKRKPLRLGAEVKAQCVRAVHALGYENVDKASVREAIKYLQAFAAKL